ncbi:MAG: hypothetical protein ACNA75_11630 [Thiohalomonadaceae bacterium]
MNQLILHPRDMNTAINEASILDTLRDLGLIDQSFDYQGKTHYQPGDAFLERMVFLGCSPVIALGEPGLTGEDFCHVSLIPSAAEPRFWHGKNIKAPRCPHCRRPQTDWQTLITQWQTRQHDYRHRCVECDKETTIDELKWRQSAGFLRSGIIVWGIYEGEAVPSEGLMDALQACSGEKWTYFYLQS